MLQVARLAPKLLGESTALVAGFFRSQLNVEGGFRDRGGRSDLYYTVFGMEGLMALQAEIPLDRIEPFLRSFGDGEGLDLVHLACLARCWAAFPPPRRQGLAAAALLSRVERHRAADGGYDAQAGGQQGNLYGCFVALGAYQDAGAAMPEPQRMLECVARLRTADGGYTNQADMPHGLTPSAAAAVVVLRHLGEQPDPALGGWLLGRCRREGGFFASPMAPVPDLLSTATALHALAALRVDFAAMVEPCLDFLDSLWTNRGGFYGTWDDDTLDCEYTYYGLLALGHLVR
jgi:prenyltransferase beta subunit